MQTQDRLVVALDVPSTEQAIAIVEVLGSFVSTYKIGFSLMFERGFHVLVDKLKQENKKVFLDAKLNDIPETVRRGVRSAARMNFDFITVHSDEAMLKAAMDGAEGEITVLAVTALTSMGGYAAEERFRTGVVNAVLAEVDGMIMSPADLKSRSSVIWRLIDRQMIIMTPGVRLPEAATDDHLRLGTPLEAISNGADFIIVGRPIVLAADPLAVAQRYCETLTS